MRLLFFWILVCCIGARQQVAAQSVSSRPNIILIIGDDISWDDLSCYNPLVPATPNLDWLSKEGMQFNRFFVTSSSCSPSRASILTGRYPHNTGAAELHSPVPEHLDYFPELLKKAGYFTALAGKWHEGPNTARAYDTLLLQNNGEGGQAQWENLLNQVPDNQPFFLWLAAFDAHRVFKSALDSPVAAKDINASDFLIADSATKQDLALYYNEIFRLDQSVGKLVQVLRKLGIEQNTVIIFLSDNGRPFPGSKTLLYDRGVQSPLLIRWPSGIAKTGSKSNALISSIDLAPTILNIAGLPASPKFQGRSFLKILNQPGRSFRRYVFLEQNWHDFEAHARAIRTGRYLYIRNNRTQFNREGPLDVKNSPSVTALRMAAKTNSLTPVQVNHYNTPLPAEEFYDTGMDSLQLSNRIQDPHYKKIVRKLKRNLERWTRITGDDSPDSLTQHWYDPQTFIKLPAYNTRGEMPGARKKAAFINKRGPF